MRLAPARGALCLEQARVLGGERLCLEARFVELLGQRACRDGRRGSSGDDLQEALLAVVREVSLPPADVQDAEHLASVQ